MPRALRLAVCFGVFLVFLVCGAATALADAPVPTTTSTTSTIVLVAPPPSWRTARFFAGSVLLSAQVSAGLEPHSFTCNHDASATCQVTAFSVGGEALWRGLLGPALGLYGSAGSPLVPGSATQQGLPDRISVAPALAVRPLATLAWSRGDGWLQRFLAGFDVQVGPSIEYLRTSSPSLAGCAIPPAAVKPGLHALAALEVPLLGNAATGWLSLRVSERLIVSSAAHLAPTMSAGAATCTAQIYEPAVASQTLFGLAYSL